ncbi:uncharacterized protein RJT21DRAFT_116183 [Scheffersomyces amazonensis]|uniref:uncharacterized protein n=1 Tax=Scheffersomyces amazonensis TaxID=1078765 RepID=UPI00315CE370
MTSDTKFLSNEDILKAISTYSLTARHTGHSFYFYLSISSSVIVLGLSIYKYYRRGSIHEDIKCSIKGLALLAGWNLFNTLIIPHIIPNLNQIANYLVNHNEQEHAKTDNYISLINTRLSSDLNYIYLMKDGSIFLLSIVSMLLIHFFSIGMVKCIEFFTSFYGIEDKEAQLQKSQITVTYEYPTGESSSIEDVTPPSLLPQFYHNRYFRKHAGIFLIVFIISLVLLPKSFQLNSSSIIFETPDHNFQIKFDHLFVALVITFSLDIFIKFFEVINFVDSYYFTSRNKFVSIFTRFIWLYDCFVLNFTIGSVILFSDVMMNLINLLINETFHSHHSQYHDNSQISVNSIQFFTSILTNYLFHSGFASNAINATQTNTICNTNSSSCLQEQIISSYIDLFTTIYVTVIDCWTVLNLMCFVIGPCLIWCVLELRLRSLAQIKS